MKRIMSAHQPNFMPYLGFFDKMEKSDIFVIRDEVQFVERDWHHRNSIRIGGEDGNGNPQSKWLTVPIKKESENIKDIVIKNDVKYKNVPWNVYMIRQIKSNYEKTPYFKQYFPRLEEILLSKKQKLIDLNMEIINFLMEAFDIRTDVLYASSLNGNKYNATVDLINLCKATGSNIYLSGAAKRRLEEELFQKEGIEVLVQDFKHPVYQQRYPGFLPNMSAIDALFNFGDFPSDARQNPLPEQYEAAIFS